MCLSGHISWLSRWHSKNRFSRSLRTHKTHWNDLELEEGSRIKYRRCGMEGKESLKECHRGMVTLKGRRDTKGEMRKTLCILNLS